MLAKCVFEVEEKKQAVCAKDTAEDIYLCSVVLQHACVLTRQSGCYVLWSARANVAGFHVFSSTCLILIL